MKTNNEIVVLEGRFKTGAPDWIYLPFEVPDGIGEIAVSYSYDRPETPTGLPGNSCDIGIFDLNGFRGYSGGARSSFTVGRSGTTTPGYIPGPIPAGTWHIMLAPYTIAPTGLGYRVNIALTPRDNAVETHAEPSYGPERAKGRGKTWYRGDLHTHTCHSDGQRTPAELAAAAREAGLDFFVSTEHNTNTAHAVWGEYASDDLLIFNGEEVTTRNGHLIAAGLVGGTWLDWRFRSVDAGDGGLSSVLQEIHTQRGLAIAAHPHAPCLGCQWKFGYDGIDAIEVWNGPWTPDDEVSLQQWNSMLVATREWIPAVGSSDTHTPDDPVGLAQTVVLAEDLSRDAIVEGIRAGRCYVTGSSEIAVEFTATCDGRTAGIGERLPVSPDVEVTVTLSVSGVADGLVRLVTDEGWAVVMPLPSDGRVTWQTTPAVSSYVRAEIRTPGPQFFEPMAAFTNPIFLGR